MPENSNVQGELTKVQRDAKALFLLLAKAADADEAIELIAGHFNMTDEMARVVLDQQLKVMLSPHSSG